jgi:hypothetical protein
MGPDASLPANNPDGGSPVNLGGPDGSSPQGAFAVAPKAAVLTVVAGMPIPTQQFTATLGGQPVTGVAWSIDRGELGKLDATGLFTPAGTIGGVANVTASNGSQKATATITINVQQTDIGDPGWTAMPGDAGAGGYGGVGGNGPGPGASGGQQGTLNGTPTADSSVSFLYPYDGTVWPRGLLAPLLQWNPGAHAFDSVYVHIKENNFEYKGYFASNTTGTFVNLPIPASAWNTMAYSNGGKSDPVTVTLVFAQGNTAYGPYTETWTIAQATLQGTIYYNSYGTALVQNSNRPDVNKAQFGAGTLAIAPGATAPTLVAGVNSISATAGDGSGCRVCHTVAANGQTLLTQESDTGGGNYATTVMINLTGDTTGGAGTPLTPLNLTYPALYKDGTILLSSTGGFAYPASGGGSSQLYSLAGGGTLVPGVTGLGSNLQAALPSFSPDGAHVSFNFWGGTLPGAAGATLSGDTASLGILDFDGKATFSNARVPYTPPSGQKVAYSSFLPDSSGVVFEIELSSPTNDFGYTWARSNAATGNTGELWWLDLATGSAHRLDALNGYGAAGAVYLPAPGAGGSPHTPAQDATLNFEPTVNPIASGGYAWVVFTSRRMYGNVAQIGPWVSDPGFYPWTTQVTDKKLWVAAIDLQSMSPDPSHPPFYLPAQELHAGNARGYWTVEPCRGNGQACTTGDQCCGGYCQAGSDGGLQCTAQAPPCAGQYEKCTTTADCCASPGIQCINGLCTYGTPK